MPEPRLPSLSRRTALELMAMSAASAVFSPPALAQSPTFPKGAIIRTLLKDYAPEELAGGATLFHEHMSLSPDFGARFGAAAAAARAANGLPPLPGRASGPPPAPPGPDPMRDVNLMSEELADRLMFSADSSRGYSKTLTIFLPKLKAAGATDDVLHRITVDNPRRFLAFVPKRPRRG